MLSNNRVSKLILVFGGGGQVGRALQNSLVNLNVPIVFLFRSECDLVDESAINKVLSHYQPDTIINAAAYTSVVSAEVEQDIAYAINAKAPQIMANYISRVPDGLFIHYSTDYVFSGNKKTAYTETDITGPAKKLSIYGQSKLMGETLIQEQFNLRRLANRNLYTPEFSRYLILRTSWIYGDGDNFIKTILQFAGKKNQLRVIANEVGAPCAAVWLAKITMRLLQTMVKSGIYNVVPNGKISRYGLARFIVDIANSFGAKISINILPIKVQEYLPLIKRPINSCLCNQKIKIALFQDSSVNFFPHWSEGVELYIKNHMLSSMNNVNNY